MIWSLSFFFWGLSIFQAPALSEQDKLQDIYKKSEQLVIDARPQEAMALLLGLLSDEEMDSSQRQKIRALLNRISELFLNERTQKLFEHGKSLYFQGQTQLSMDRFKEALVLEPHNLKVLVGHSRALLYLDQCGEALSQIQKGREKNPYHEDLAVLFLMASLCQGRGEEFMSHLEEITPLLQSPQSQLQRKSMQASWLYGQGKFAEVFSLAQELVEGNEGFPKGHLWIWRSAQKMDEEDFARQGGRQAGRRYISLCKGVSSRLRRTYENQTDLCRSVREVELYFEKLERER